MDPDTLWLLVPILAIVLGYRAFVLLLERKQNRPAAETSAAADTAACDALEERIRVLERIVTDEPRKPGRRFRERS